MANYFILNAGCSRRALDAEKINMYLKANGNNIVNDPKKAGKIILVTCGLEENEKESISLIRKFKDYNGELIVTGCLPDMNPEIMKKNFDGKTISTKQLGNIDELFPENKIRFDELPDANREFTGNISTLKKTLHIKELKSIIMNSINIQPFSRFMYNILQKKDSFGTKKTSSSFAEKIRYNLKDVSSVSSHPEYFAIRISEGCLGACSFCTIKNAIGRSRSKPIDIVLEELRNGLKNRNYNINIYSSDSGSYGLDIGTNFPKLIESILNENKKIVIQHIQDMHPSWMCKYKKDFLRIIATRRINSIQTPFQSGSKKILSLMARSYAIDEYISLLNEMKKTYPNFKIRTQIIVGFPTETDKDFEDTLKVIKQVRFDCTDIFTYYENRLTPSAKLFPKVQRKKAIERAKKIISLISEQKGMYYFDYKNKDVAAL